jgi:hypothetical protein
MKKAVYCCRCAGEDDSEEGMARKGIARNLESSRSITVFLLLFSTLCPLHGTIASSYTREE